MVVRKRRNIITFGEKLSSLRKQANMTQADLADKLNISRQAVTKWEKGVGLPDLDNVKKLSSIFNVSIDELLDYKIEEVKLELDVKTEKMNKENAKIKNIDKFILEKHNSSDAVYKLYAEPKLGFWKSLIYTMFDIDVALLAHDLMKNGLTYSYLVEEKGNQYLVIVNKNTLMTKKMKEKFGKKLIVDGYCYEKIRNGNIK